MIYAAFAILTILAIVLPVVAVQVTNESNSRERQVLLSELSQAHSAHIALLTQQLDIKDATVARQQETIEKTHTRLLLPMENAITDVRNQDEKLPSTIQPQQIIPQEEYPSPEDFVATTPDLPYDLDTPPDDL